jgi:hypothetical protein
MAYPGLFFCPEEGQQPVPQVLGDGGNGLESSQI